MSSSASSLVHLLTFHSHHHDRIERNNFSSVPFEFSFCIFRSGKIQARCSKISADVTDMIASCKDVHSILREHRSTIEAPASTSGARQQHSNGGSPPRAPSSSLIQSSSAISYPKGIMIMRITFTNRFSRDTRCSFTCRLGQAAVRNDGLLLQI
jgi:hypothetical protein